MSASRDKACNIGIVLAALGGLSLYFWSSFVGIALIVLALPFGLYARHGNIVGLFDRDDDDVEEDDF